MNDNVKCSLKANRRDKTLREARRGGQHRHKQSIDYGPVSRPLPFLTDTTLPSHSMCTRRTLLEPREIVERLTLTRSRPLLHSSTLDTTCRHSPSYLMAKGDCQWNDGEWKNQKESLKVSMICQKRRGEREKEKVFIDLFFSMAVLRVDRSGINTK